MLAHCCSRANSDASLELTMIGFFTPVMSSYSPRSYGASGVKTHDPVSWIQRDGVIPDVASLIVGSFQIHGPPLHRSGGYQSAGVAACELSLQQALPEKRS